MNYLAEIFSIENLSFAYNFFGRYPEALLLVGFLFLLLLRGKYHAALMLLLGVTLCLANYYLFFQFSIYLE